MIILYYMILYDIIWYVSELGDWWEGRGRVRPLHRNQQKKLGGPHGGGLDESRGLGPGALCRGRRGATGLAIRLESALPTPHEEDMKRTLFLNTTNEETMEQGREWSEKWNIVKHHTDYNIRGRDRRGPTVIEKENTEMPHFIINTE